MRFKTERERQAKRAARQQTAELMHVWRCDGCGFLAIAPPDVAALDPDFELCPNCDFGGDDET